MFSRLCSVNAWGLRLHIHGRQQPLSRNRGHLLLPSLMHNEVLPYCNFLCQSEQSVPFGVRRLSRACHLTVIYPKQPDVLFGCSADHLCQKVWFWQCREQKQRAHAEDVAPHACCGQDQTAHMVKAFAYLEISEGSWCPTSLLYSQRRNTTTPAKSMLPETLAAARLWVVQVVGVVANAQVALLSIRNQLSGDCGLTFLCSI